MINKLNISLASQAMYVHTSTHECTYINAYIHLYNNGSAKCINIEYFDCRTVFRRQFCLKTNTTAHFDIYIALLF